MQYVPGGRFYQTFMLALAIVFNRNTDEDYETGHTCGRITRITTVEKLCSLS